MNDKGIYFNIKKMMLTILWISRSNGVIDINRIPDSEIIKWNCASDWFLVISDGEIRNEGYIYNLVYILLANVILIWDIHLLEVSEKSMYYVAYILDAASILLPEDDL